MSDTLTITGLARDEGTIVLLAAIDGTGDNWIVAADHRPAQDILEALAEGEDVEVANDGWNAWRAQ